MSKLSSSRGIRAQYRRRAVSGILAAVILFAMLFVAGMSYLIYINQASQAVVQANAARQGAELISGKESLTTRVTLTGGASPNYLVVSANNTGGTSSVISYIYVTDLSGKLVSNFMGPAPQAGTNATALWPISLSPGQSTGLLKGCVSGKTGCNIELTGFSFSGSPVMVEVVTKSGNTFSAQYPPASGPLNQPNPLVVSMVATPPQVFSCSAPNCITLTVTVYNYAPSPVTNVQLNPNPPTPLVTGTAGVGVSGGSCGAPSPSSNIPGYTSGNPSSITFTCTYSSTTGPVGGFASFSGGALGTLGAGAAASAQAISNTIQIGGNSNVPTQGAFAANYFFVKYSACQNGPSGSAGSYSYSSPCSTAPATMPPASLNTLTSGNYISGFSDFYVAYYVQVTNDFNATLPILEYSYLFSDPGISTEAYSFLVGTATTPYFPNYCNNISSPCASNHIPQLTAYGATATTCTNTPSQCIEVAPGQTVTLTFAACGWGSSNWVWGGTPYGESLDNPNGCITTPPGYIWGTGQLEVPEGQTLSIVLSYLYKGNVYIQSMPFEGQEVTNLRTTSTALSCSPTTDPVNAPSSCTVTVTDLSSGTPVTPTGTVTLTQDPLTGGTFSTGSSCPLSGSLGVATCTFTYTPGLGQEQTDYLTASFPGDTSHSGSSSATLAITATQRSTSTSVVCTPSSGPPNTATNCKITVTDTSPGTTVVPTGTVSLTQSPASSGAFNSTSCTLSAVGACFVSYTPNSGFKGTVTISAAYSGDKDHAVSSGSAPVMWADSTRTTVACSPNPQTAGLTSTCTATVTDTATSSPTTPTGVVTFSQNGGTGSVTFPSGTTCPLSSGSCQVTVTGSTAGTATIQASYPGDATHFSSQGSTTLTVNKAVTTTTVTCSGQTCTATITGYVGTIGGETITFSQNGGTGTIAFPAGTTCVLAGASCSVQVAGTATGSPVVQAAYPGDSNNALSSGTHILTIGTDTLTVSCNPTTFNVAANSVCTATLTGYTGSVTGETITFSQNGGTGGVTFPSGTTCSLSSGSCQVTVTITGSKAGTATIQASYPGDTANVAKTATQTVTVNAKAPAHLVQTVTLSGCTNLSGSSCSGTVTVANANDVMVVTVSTMSTEGSCASVSTISGQKGDSSYSQVPSASASASYSASGLKNCAFSAIYYATATSTGSDKITVTLTSSLSSSQGDTSVVVVYEINSVMTPYTGTSGSCNNGSCSLTIVTSLLSVSANSFLATTAADCQSPTGHQRTISPGPSGFTTDYGTGNAEYAGHEISSSTGSQTFSMTSSTGMSGNPVCWSVVGVQFLDPPIGPPASPSSTQSSSAIGRTVTSLSSLGFGDVLGVSVFSVCIMSMALEFPKKTKTTCHPREAQFKR